MRKVRMSVSGIDRNCQGDVYTWQNLKKFFKKYAKCELIGLRTIGELLLGKSLSCV